ncbi:putative gustatory receptor 2a [Phlebotomus argentipes]|uniref:putative gustatory receptor 2a n=1 Tax=Phlebotomus argentipes TaxID=94469 RepID=UPI00289356E1|nr:putative gustatory receptor 2a [Phlebotomus argentipes]
MKEFQYYNLIRLIKRKILIMNRSLEKLSRWDKIGLTNQQQKFQILRTHLESLRGIHCSIVNLICDVQRAFGPYLLVSVIAAFGVITVQLYYIFATSIQAINFNIPMMAITLIWTSTQALLILANVMVCSSTRNASKAIGGALLSIREAVEYPEIFHIVQLFSFQLWHKEVNFSACGFFKLDSKLITSIVAAVTTYLVLMIQFHLSNSENAANFLKYNVSVN